MPHEDAIEKLNEHFKDAHKNKGFVKFVRKLRDEVEDIDTFINSMSEAELDNLFHSMLLSMHEEADNHELYHQAG